MNAVPESFIKSLPELADKYIQECLENTKEVATPSGKILKVMDRHIPTIDYFLRIWLPKENKNSTKKTIPRSTWYEWLSLEQSDKFTAERNRKIKLKSDTIKNINAIFSALATDIVANEGKGIFYAKNKLGMTDRVDTKVDATIRSAEPVTGMEIK